MEAFFPDLLKRFEDPAFIEKTGQKFHYERSQTAELQAVAGQMLPLMQREACWERREGWREGQLSEMACRNREDVADWKNKNYEEIVMTLGQGLDDLQTNYAERGMLSECYMLEALASELLLEGYSAYAQYIRENTAFHVGRYHFYGSEEDFPLEMLPRVLEAFTLKVSCNKAYCLLPKKSVAFVAELTQDERIQCQGICVGCNSAHCPNRITDDSRMEKKLAGMADLPLNYGYRRIFGKPTDQQMLAFF